MCDNVSNNDIMVRELEKQVPAFANEASLTRCFLHLVNPVARTTIRIFDIPEKNSRSTNNGGDGGDPIPAQAQQQLEKLSENLELEDAETHASMVQDVQESDKDKDFQDDLENSTKGWIDERELMGDKDNEILDVSVIPVWLDILKVHRHPHIVLCGCLISVHSCAICPMPSFTH